MLKNKKKFFLLKITKTNNFCSLKNIKIPIKGQIILIILLRILPKPFKTSFRRQYNPSDLDMKYLD